MFVLPSCQRVEDSRHPASDPALDKKRGVGPTESLSGCVEMYGHEHGTGEGWDR